MKISKIVSVVVFAGLAVAAASASADSGSGSTPVPPKVSCKAGTLTATPADPSWRPNGAAPWKWDQAAGAAATFKGCDKDNHCDSATISGGSSCSGTLTAFVCSGSQCSPPLKVAVH